MTPIELVDLAIEAREHSYCPYSHFAVGAALECEDGTVFTGCNIENASYTPTICAERTAISKAVSEGYLKFKRIAIAGRSEDFCVPCGVCRQVMMEFCDPKTFQIILAVDKNTYKIMTLEELLPMGFGPANLA
jgi:cytidine deaminase